MCSHTNGKDIQVGNITMKNITEYNFVIRLKTLSKLQQQDNDDVLVIVVIHVLVLSFISLHET